MSGIGYQHWNDVVILQNYYSKVKVIFCMQVIAQLSVD